MNNQENTLYDRPDGGEWRCEERGVYSVLDHGYVHVVESWGSDQQIIESARMSTDKGFLGWGPKCKECGLSWPDRPDSCTNDALRDDTLHDDGPGDEKLLRYLYENKHSTPFEFAGLTIEVQAPLMVFREWHRHRVPFGYSEMSARYVQMPNLHYVPSVQRIIDSAKKSVNKQASGGGALDFPGFFSEGLPERRDVQMAKEIRHQIQAEQLQIYDFYENMLSWGVSKEIARLDTPVSRYSRMRATGNLRGWLGFLTLRMAPGAQFEIRQFAHCVADVVATTFPRTYELFNEGMKPILDPESVDTPEKAWARGASLMRAAFHQHAPLGDNDPLWEISIPEYKRPEP